MGVAQARLERALAVSHGWYEVGDSTTLPERILGDLLELIGADAAGWNEIGPEPGALRIVSVPSEKLALDPSLLAERLHENPLVAHLPRLVTGVPITFSDVVTQRELHRRELYQVFYRPLGVEYQLAVAISAGPPLVAIAFNRRQRDFGVGERRLLELLQPHVAAAYRATVERVVARRRLEALERGLASPGGALVVHTGDRVERAGEDALDLLERWFGSRELLPEGLAEGTRELVLETPGARLRVRRVPGEPGLLLLDERRLDAMRLRAARLGLTAREAEVAAAAALDRTSREIAEELEISVRTVEKHLEHVFAKLGVSGRRETAAALAGR